MDGFVVSVFAELHGALLSVGLEAGDGEGQGHVVEGLARERAQLGEREPQGLVYLLLSPKSLSIALFKVHFQSLSSLRKRAYLTPKFTPLICVSFFKESHISVLDEFPFFVDAEVSSCQLQVVEDDGLADDVLEDLDIQRGLETGEAVEEHFRQTAAHEPVLDEYSVVTRHQTRAKREVVRRVPRVRPPEEPVLTPTKERKSVAYSSFE